MIVYKYTLLGAFLIAKHQSDAAVIKAGQGCTIYDAIKAANTDRRVNRCRPGRGADTILHDRNRVFPSIEPYPTIRSQITISGVALFEASGPSFFRVARQGHLTLNSEVRYAGIVVSGRLTMPRFSGIVEDPDGACAIIGRPGAQILRRGVRHITGAYEDGCGISLNKATLKAYGVRFGGEG